MPSGIRRWWRSLFSPAPWGSTADSQMQILSDVTRALGLTHEGPTTVYRIITEAVTGLLTVERSRLFVPDATGTLRVAAISGLAPSDGDAIPPAVQRAFRSGSAQLDVQAGSSMVAAPLKLQNDVIGVISAQAKRDGGSFGGDDLRLLEVFATLAALVASEAKLIVELRRRNADIESLLTIARQVNSEASPDVVLNTVLHAAVQRTRARSGSLMFVDPDRRELVIRAAEGLPSDIAERLHLAIGQGVTGWVAREGKSARIEDVRADDRYVAARGSVLSELAVPIRTANEIFGVLNVDADTVAAFSGNDQVFLEALADLAAARIRLAFSAQGGER